MYVYRGVPAFTGVPRVGWALIFSALVHFALIFYSPRTAWRADYIISGIETPAVTVRIVHIPAARPVPPKPIAGKRPTGLQIRREPPPETTHDQKPEREKPQPGHGHPDVIPGAAIPLGVSVSETLYLTPLPRRFAAPLLDSEDYVRDKDLGERPTPIRLALPEYPKQALEAKVGGWITVALYLDQEGRVVDAAAADASESLVQYQDQVVEALRHSLFTPGKVDGRATRSLVFQVVRFDPRLRESNIEPSGTSAAAKTP
jgi:hypothetical protein